MGRGDYRNYYKGHMGRKGIHSLNSGHGQPDTQGGVCTTLDAGERLQAGVEFGIPPDLSIWKWGRGAFEKLSVFLPIRAAKISDYDHLLYQREGKWGPRSRGQGNAD